MARLEYAVRQKPNFAMPITIVSHMRWTEEELKKALGAERARKVLGQTPAVSDLARHVAKLDRESNEDFFARQLLAVGAPAFERQYKWHPGRMFRADFAWPQFTVIVQIEGGTKGIRGGKKCATCGQMPLGKHSRPAGYELDCEMRALAVLAGWRVLSFTTAQLQSGFAIRTTKILFGIRGDDE